MRHILNPRLAHVSFIVGLWGRFIEAVRTGSRQSVPALGFEQFEYYAHSPREASAFTLSMQGSSELVQQEVLRLVDVKGASIVADLGGANGSLVCAPVNANPGLEGIVLELRHVVDSAATFASERGVSDRVSAIAGDFFEWVPAADLAPC